MIFIDFDKNKCDECYKCLRVCPTKAISFNKNRRDIIDDLCIKCGLCQQACPQGALKIHSDIDNVKHFINTTHTVIASLAPSFASAFDIDNPLKIVAALKKLGFDAVEETGIGAEAVSDSYKKYIDTYTGNNIITTCCPSANYIIEKYYPDLTSTMLPVVSPMIAHGKIIKENHGRETKVVFLGPCLAKKAESKDIKNSVDAVLTFNELDKWLKEKSIDLQTISPENFDKESPLNGKEYPLGVLSSCTENTNYEYIKVDTFDRCKDILSDLSNDKLKNMFIELNVCQGSCINGPDYPDNEISYFQRLDKINKYVNKSKSLDTDVSENCIKVNLNRRFNSKKTIKDKPSENKLKELLRKIDKYEESDYLNCRACGYNRCIDKAEASYYGYSDIYMCMPYLRSKAESLQSVIFDNSPNLIFILNENLEILDYNPAFNNLFNKHNINLKNHKIDNYIDDAIFKRTFDIKENIVGVKKRYENLDKVFFVNSLYIKNNSILVAIMTDITSNEKNKEELEIVKEETLNICQKVIDKQMRVAQNIASILGETTAETKVNLNRLKDVVLDEEVTKIE